MHASAECCCLAAVVAWPKEMQKIKMKKSNWSESNWTFFIFSIFVELALQLIRSLVS